MHLLREFVSFFPLPIRQRTMYSIRHSIIFGTVIHKYMYTPSYVTATIQYHSSTTSWVLASKHLLTWESLLIKGAWHMFCSQVFTPLIKEAWHTFHLCAMPLLYAIILGRANAYSWALVTLRLSSTVCHLVLWIKQERVMVTIWSTLQTKWWT